MDAMADRMDNQEMISALADGQLRGEAFALGVRAASEDARGREAWCAYHAVGEVLRTGRAGSGASQEAFLARLRERLQQEQAVAGPAPQARPLVVASAQPAANDWLWKLAAGVASVAAVAAVGWNMWGGAGSGSGQPQLATAPSAQPILVEAGAAPMIRDPRLDKLLAAHRQLGGGTALNTSAGFVRNATFEGPAR